MGTVERKEREKKQRKNMILDAAEKIFFTKGINKSTMDEVAEKAEFSKGTLYLYFKSKEDIRFAIFQRGAEILNEMMKKQISEDHSGKENLLSLGRTFIHFSKKYKDYFSLFIEIQSRNMELLNIGKESLEHYIKYQSPISIVQQCVKQGMEDGSLRQDISINCFTATLWSQMLGVMTVINNHSHIFKFFDIKPENILETHLEIAQKGSDPR